MRHLSKLLMATALFWGAGCDGDLFRTSHGGVDEANEAMAAGKTEEALKAYEAAAAEIPESPELSYDRGVALSGAGRHDEATQMLLRALDTRDPELRFKVYAALGAAYAAWGMDIEHGKAVDAAPPEPPPDDEAPAARPSPRTRPSWRCRSGSAPSSTWRRPCWCTPTTRTC
jgi:hypothetical protein